MTCVFLNGTLGLSGLQTSQQSALGGGLFNRGAGQMGGLGTGLGKNELEFYSVYSGTICMRDALSTVHVQVAHARTCNIRVHVCRRAQIGLVCIKIFGICASAHVDRCHLHVAC